MEETQDTCRVLFLALHGVSMGVGFIITNLICLMDLSVIGVMFHNQKVKKKKVWALEPDLYLNLLTLILSKLISVLAVLFLPQLLPAIAAAVP